MGGEVPIVAPRADVLASGPARGPPHRRCDRAGLGDERAGNLCGWKLKCSRATKGWSTFPWPWATRHSCSPSSGQGSPCSTPFGALLRTGRSGAASLAGGGLLRALWVSPWVSPSSCSSEGCSDLPQLLVRKANRRAGSRGVGRRAANQDGDDVASTDRSFALAFELREPAFGARCCHACVVASDELVEQFWREHQLSKGTRQERLAASSSAWGEVDERLDGPAPEWFACW